MEQQGPAMGYEPLGDGPEAIGDRDGNSQTREGRSGSSSETIGLMANSDAADANADDRPELPPTMGRWPRRGGDADADNGRWRRRGGGADADNGRGRRRGDIVARRHWRRRGGDSDAADAHADDRPDPPPTMCRCMAASVTLAAVTLAISLVVVTPFGMRLGQLSRVVSDGQPQAPIVGLPRREEPGLLREDDKTLHRKEASLGDGKRSSESDERDLLVFVKPKPKPKLPVSNWQVPPRTSPQTLAFPSDAEPWTGLAMDAQVMDSLEQCQAVRGTAQNLADGSLWIKLDQDAGDRDRWVSLDRFKLQKVEFTTLSQPGHTCQEPGLFPIASMDHCKMAALDMGITKKVFSTWLPIWPEGCIVLNESTVLLNTNPAGKGDDTSEVTHVHASEGKGKGKGKDRSRISIPARSDAALRALGTRHQWAIWPEVGMSHDPMVARSGNFTFGSPVKGNDTITGLVCSSLEPCLPIGTTHTTTATSTTHTTTATNTHTTTATSTVHTTTVTNATHTKTATNTTRTKTATSPAHTKTATNTTPTKTATTPTTTTTATSATHTTTATSSTSTTHTATATNTTHTTTATSTTHTKMFDGEWESLFCFVVAAAQSYEPGLLRFARSRKSGVYGCEEHLTLTDSKIDVGTRDDPEVTTAIGSLESEMGDWGSWSNAGVFVKAWKAVMEDGRFRKHDWTVKLDADAVFFPIRLKCHVEQMGLNGQGTPSDMMFLENFFEEYPVVGAVEVLSNAAMLAFDQRIGECEDLAYGAEDDWLVKCMRALGARGQRDEELLVHEKNDLGCHNGRIVTMHPYKSLEDYRRCLEEADEAGEEQKEAASASAAAGFDEANQ